MASPLAQFEIKSLIDIPIKVGDNMVDLSFTNSSLWMLITVIVGVSFMAFCIRKREIIPGHWQAAGESVFEFIVNMVKSNVGSEGAKYVPFVFCLFLFIFTSNLLGLIPYSFTVNSHIIVTMAMALFVFVGITAIGIIKHGLHFFSFFVPKGAPIAMYPLMIPIEVISYLSRPVSLSVRLFANMMAGHTMIKVFAGFVFGLGAASFGIAGILPIVMNVLLVGFEILVAFLQAYVFCVLSCMYLNDALHLH